VAVECRSVTPNLDECGAATAGPLGSVGSPHSERAVDGCPAKFSVYDHLFIQVSTINSHAMIMTDGSSGHVGEFL